MTQFSTYLPEEQSPNSPALGKPSFSSTLLVGWGNPNNEDEGIAWHLIFELARHLSRTVPVDPRSGFFSAGYAADILFIQHFDVSLAEKMSAYQRVCFIHGHTNPDRPAIAWNPVYPNSSWVSGQPLITPADCLAQTRLFSAGCPAGAELTLRSYSFQACRELSPQASALIKPASNQLFHWLNNCM